MDLERVQSALIDGCSGPADSLLADCWQQRRVRAGERTPDGRMPGTSSASSPTTCTRKFVHRPSRTRPHAERNAPTLDAPPRTASVGFLMELSPEMVRLMLPGQPVSFRGQGPELCLNWRARTGRCAPPFLIMWFDFLAGRAILWNVITYCVVRALDVGGSNGTRTGFAGSGSWKVPVRSCSQHS